ncbi:hypothetical protein DICVIV_11808 [Dictyocaulus viviparus]|uniref:Reverse transcriptase domain-containing protein n=1 Tax=Dictyocaulus viviparus TaxID=29172 RepID=A0A0D8XIS2_DICVI|nr:hypothetical protein DICVIV_11808 [Dictyocaulus viviparus]
MTGADMIATFVYLRVMRGKTIMLFSTFFLQDLTWNFVVKNRTGSSPDRIGPQHLKNLSPVLIKTLARLFTRYLSDCKVPSQWKTSRTVLLHKKGDTTTSHCYDGKPTASIKAMEKITHDIYLGLFRSFIYLHPSEQAITDVSTNQVLIASYIDSS